MNRNYESMVAREGKPYHPDTIQVLNKAGDTQHLMKTLVNQPQGETWIFDFNFLEGKVPVDTDFKKLDKTFYLYLNQHDVDTLRVFGKPDSVFINGKRLRGAPNSQVIQYSSFFYIKG